MNQEHWNKLTTEQKIEALREIVELLASLAIEMSVAFSDIISQSVEEFKEKYSHLEEELFGGGSK